MGKVSQKKIGHLSLLGIMFIAISAAAFATMMGVTIKKPVSSTGDIVRLAG